VNKCGVLGGQYRRRRSLKNVANGGDKGPV
jgi:hypothetical protein